MSNQLVIAAVGEDRPGLVDNLSGWILDSGCNIADSRMTVLGGEFAVLLLAEGQWNNLAKLEEMKIRGEQSDLEKEREQLEKILGPGDPAEHLEKRRASYEDLVSQRESAQRRVDQVRRRVCGAAVLAGVAVLVLGAAARALALDEPVRQKHLLFRVECLGDGACCDVAGIEVPLVVRLQGTKAPEARAMIADAGTSRGAAADTSASVRRRVVKGKLRGPRKRG